MAAGDASGSGQCAQLLAGDPSVARRMGERGRSAFLTDHERKLCCNEWCGLIAALVARPQVEREGSAWASPFLRSHRHDSPHSFLRSDRLAHWPACLQPPLKLWSREDRYREIPNLVPGHRDLQRFPRASSASRRTAPGHRGRDPGQARPCFHPRASRYLRQNPKAADRDQAYAALFNKAIEHDWFAETEDLGRQYLKSDPDGPVKALAQIILTMARAQAGRFDEALAQFRELMQGLNQNEQEEFAASFSEDLATLAITAGEFAAAREVYTSLLDRFSDSPTLRQKIQAELKRLDKVGKTCACVRGGRHPGAADSRRGLPRQVRFDRFLGDLVLAVRRRAAAAPGRLPQLS